RTMGAVRRGAGNRSPYSMMFKKWHNSKEIGEKTDSGIKTGKINSRSERFFLRIRANWQAVFGTLSFGDDWGKVVLFLRRDRSDD
ncbi:MAG: hypothetical protein Q4E62_06305, partial [Sutterellaceae bacterium]|nr:hypothetical protein [Sutterellaceae bacterium]